MVHHCRLIHAVGLIVLTWKLCPNPLSSESSYSWWTEGEDWRQLRSLTQQHLDQAGQGLEIGCCKRVKGDLMSMWLPSIGCATEDKWLIGFAATKLGITSTGLKGDQWIIHIHILLKAYTVRVDGSHPHLVVFFKWHWRSRVALGKHDVIIHSSSNGRDDISQVATLSCVFARDHARTHHLVFCGDATRGFFPWGWNQRWTRFSAKQYNIILIISIGYFTI